MDHSERMMRAQIERLPDGRYEAEGSFDGYLDHPDPAYRGPDVKVAVTISGSDLDVDLTGTAPQVDLPINMPFVGTVDVAIYVTLRSLLLDSARHDPVAPTPACSARSRSRPRSARSPTLAFRRRRSPASAPATSSPTR